MNRGTHLQGMVIAWQALRRVGTWLTQPRASWTLFVALFLFFAHSSLEVHDRLPKDDYRSVLRADAAGYYVYLPAFFHYGFLASAMTAEQEHLGGMGFLLDHERDRVVTKYTFGTALLYLPFYLAAESYAGWGLTDGWSRDHRRAIKIAGMFYWALGLYLLFRALQLWSPGAHGWNGLVIALVAFGTNSFFYAYASPGFSHCASFFLVSWGLFMVLRARNEPLGFRGRLLFASLCAMIICVRPIDAILVLALYALLLTMSPVSFGTLRLPLIQSVALAVLALPQMLYWKFVFGHWLVYAYAGEGFTEWAHPQWKAVLFAPRNGLLPHAPVLVVLPWAFLAVLRQSAWYGSIIVLCFLAGLYSMASWHAWHFGCGYGLRPMVDYLPLLALALSSFLTRFDRAGPIRWVGVCLLGLACFVNYRAMIQFDHCYRWEEWDWSGYLNNLSEAFFGQNPPWR